MKGFWLTSLLSSGFLIAALVVLSASSPTSAFYIGTNPGGINQLEDADKPSCRHRPSDGAGITAADEKPSLAVELTSGNTIVARALTTFQNASNRPADCLDHANAGHKLLLPMVAKDYVMLAVAIVTLFIAAGGGIGGGAVYVPMYILIGGFTTVEAVALSNITIMGGALANFLFNIRRRHPLLPRPLIDWDLILVMEPTTMLGALFGSYLNKLLPVWVTSCLLAVLLGLITLKLVQRGVQVYVAEGLGLEGGRHGGRHEQQQRQQQRVEAEKEGLREPLLLSGEGSKQQQVAGEGDLAAAATGYQVEQGQGVTEEGSVLHDEQQQVLGGCWRGSNGQGPYVPPDAVQKERVAAVAAAGGEAAAGEAADAPLLEPIDSDLYQSNQQQRLAAAAATAAGAEAAVKPHADCVVSCSVCCIVQQQQPGTAALVNATAGPGSCCKLARVYRREAVQLPLFPLLVLFLLAAVVVLSDTFKAYVPCGSLQYWLVVLSVVPVCFGVMLVVRQHLLQKGRLKAAAGMFCGGGNVRWSPKNTVVYPFICSLAGVFAGLFGVGGGVVKGPLMLELGVCPEVAAATSATMIAFTAGSACVVYVHFGGLIWSYAWVLLVVAFVVTLLGQITTAAVVRLLGRRSVIVFAMVLLMALATGIALYQAGLNWEHALRHPKKMWRGGTICRVR